MRAVLAAAAMLASASSAAPAVMHASASPTVGMAVSSAAPAVMHASASPTVGMAVPPSPHGSAGPVPAPVMHASASPMGMSVPTVAPMWVPVMHASASPTVGMAVPPSPHSSAAPVSAPVMHASASPTMGMAVPTVAPMRVPVMHASASPTVGMAVPPTPPPTMGSAPTASPTVGMAQATRAPSVGTETPRAGTRATHAPVACADDAAFHVKGCNYCTCQWFAAQDRCQRYGKAQGVVRDAVTGRWHRANTACCACQNAVVVATPATASPTAYPIPQVPGNGVHTGGCRDRDGDDVQGHQRAFCLKDCPQCTCAWFAAQGRCNVYRRYTGEVRDRRTRSFMKAADACCTCGGGDH